MCELVIGAALPIYVYENKVMGVRGDYSHMGARGQTKYDHTRLFKIINEAEGWKSLPRCNQLITMYPGDKIRP